MVRMSFRLELWIWKGGTILQRALDINVTAKIFGDRSDESNLAVLLSLPWENESLDSRLLNEAVQTGERKRGSLSKGFRMYVTGMSCFGKGLYYEEAEKHFIKGFIFQKGSISITWNGTARISLGETYFEMGDFLRSKDITKRKLDLRA